jgi:glutamate/tyrosine decarboxylase-like PLP-dependent enzyme
MTTSPDLARLRAAVATPLPHPDADAMRALGRQVADWTAEHWAALRDNPVGRTATRAQMNALLREPPPEDGRPFAEVLRRFEEQVVSNALSTKHPRFLAFVPGAPAFPGVLGDWLCAATNYFAGVWKEAPGPTEVELVVLDWFRDLLGFPAATAGLLTGGGSEANLTALAVAREPLSPDQRQKACLYVNEHRHWSVDRAAKILGLLPGQVRPVPAAADFRFTAAALDAAVEADRRDGRLPWGVVANAGATGTGTVDPLGELADVAGRHGLWLHVDAAYGWPAVLTAEGRRLLAGIERADSVTLDPHKWFAQPFEAGCLLVRDGRRLTETFAQEPDYMQDVMADGDEVNFCDRGIALTRRFRALKIWLSVQVFGLGWYRRLVEHCCGLAAYAEARLRELPEFEILNPRALSIVAFRLKPPALSDEAELDRLNLQAVETLLASGRAFISSTRLHGRVALRFCFVNWRTTADDVDAILEMLRLVTSPPGPLP